jgi:hypothetical protein
MASFIRHVLFAVLSLSLLEAVGVATCAAKENSNQAALDDGYSLFYDFCNQESQVAYLRWIKTMPPDIANFAKEISDTATSDMATLKKFGVVVDKVSLPPFELAVRKSMADDRKQQLVWDNSGGKFAVAMAMVQAEVTNYGLHVAKTLAEKETDPDRARAMRKMCEAWTKLHLEAYRLAR